MQEVSFQIYFNTGAKILDGITGEKSIPGLE
jgi:hypothetical protein